MKVLWVDDLSEDDGYSELRELLSRLSDDSRLNPMHGFQSDDLDICIDADQFLKQAREDKYDLVIIDYKIPPTTGIEVARRMLAEVGNIRIVFLSEWVVQFDPRQKLDPRAVYTVVEKPDERLNGDEWYETELGPAVQAILDRPMATFTPPQISDEARGLLPYKPSDFDRLPFDEQMRLQADALHLIEDYLDRLFEQSSAAWVILTWPDLVIGYWGRIDDPPRSENDRIDLENAHDGISIVASRPLEVGEIGNRWSECLDSVGIEEGGKDLYPSLGIEIEGWRVFINVDTGAVSSFLSLEDMVEGGLESHVPNQSRFAWQPEKILLGPQRHKEVVLSAIFDRDIDVDSLDGTVPIRLRARIVREFRKTGLARVCATGDCHRSVPRHDSKYWCGHRKGLIGRDIVRLNPMRLVIDSIARRCYVLLGENADETVLGEYPSTTNPDRFTTYRSD